MDNLLSKTKRLFKTKITTLRFLRGTKIYRAVLKNRYKRRYIISLVCLIAIVVLLAIGYPLNDPSAKISIIPASTKLTLADITGYENYDDLPIGKTTLHEAPDAWGTVFYIPQFHRNPGSEVDDAINDSAQKTQEQIYEVIPFLSENFNADLVMLEGELNGEVLRGKIDNITAKVQRRNDFVNLCNLLKSELRQGNLSPALEEKFFKKVDDTVAELDREIILQGAPFLLKAEGVDLALVGSENKETQEESRVLVKDYIYLKDRASQLEKPYGKLSRSENGANHLFSEKQLSLLKQLVGSSSSLKNSFEEMESTALSQGRDDLAGIIVKAHEAFDGLKEIGKNKNNSSAVSSRADNPYNSVVSKAKIDSMLEDAEKGIEEIVVDRRNIETAENFADTLKKENETTGILQYGAGHEEGLIKEFNSRGISVVVVTPEEVFSRRSN